MSSLETRSTSALFKRAEQLKRWHNSETAKESCVPRTNLLNNNEKAIIKTKRFRRPSKVQFTDSIVFLAACSCGDKEEVEKLLNRGTNIDTTNVDGLTALHQACIDDNLEMVEFLVSHGADVNKGDNEGWTPFHATASCGFLSIARFLIDSGADLASVNNDGELAVDISESDEMESLLQKEMELHGVNCEESRKLEEILMLKHATDWMNSGIMKEKIHPKTGATALHVASAKGYTNIIRILLKAGANTNAQDFDGWTPLHAAAHWGQLNSCQILIKHLADVKIKNYVNQTFLDVADPEIMKELEELKRQQVTVEKSTVEPKHSLPTFTMLHSNETILSNDSTKKRESKTNYSIEERLDLSRQSNQEKQLTTKMENKIFASEHSVISNVTKEKLTHPQFSQNDFKDTNTPNYPKSTLNTSSLSLISKPLLEDQDVHPWRRNLSLRSRPTSSFDTKGTKSSIEEDIFLKKPNKDLEEIKSSLSNETKSKLSLNPIRRSFVPPVRDEESETQRKAHAKRVRETRRSTQGVTLEDLKSAEQLVKKKQQQENQIRTTELQLLASSEVGSTAKGTTNNKSTTESVKDNGQNLSPSKSVFKTKNLSYTGDIEDDKVFPTKKQSNLHENQSLYSNKSLTSDKNLDYKQLWESSQKETTRLREEVDKLLKEVESAKKINTNMALNDNKSTYKSKDSNDILEKKSLEKKIAQMEEDLKQMVHLKNDNQRLRDENGALIRVISKLSK